MKKFKHGGSRPGAGRPPSGDPPMRARAFKCTDEEWDKIRKLALKNGYVRADGEPNASEYIRAKTLGG